MYSSQWILVQEYRKVEFLKKPSTWVITLLGGILAVGVYCYRNNIDLGYEYRVWIFDQTFEVLTKREEITYTELSDGFRTLTIMMSDIGAYAYSRYEEAVSQGADDETALAHAARAFFAYSDAATMAHAMQALEEEAIDFTSEEMAGRAKRIEGWARMMESYVEKCQQIADEVSQNHDLS